MGAAVPVDCKNLVVLEINVKMVLASRCVGFVFVVEIRTRQVPRKLSQKLLGCGQYRIDMNDGFIDLNYDMFECGAHAFDDVLVFMFIDIRVAQLPAC